MRLTDVSARSSLLRTLVIGALFAIVALVPLTASAAPPKDLSGEAPGMELTARWWQVALAPGDLDFWFSEEPGANCRQVDLPSGPVVLVAGTFGGPSGDRVCTVPAGATVVLPAINSIYVLTDPPPADTIGVARAYNRGFLDGATAEATIDGIPARVRSISSSAFMVNGEVFGLGPLRAVSDGYWLVWKATPGEHIVTTSGATADGGFTSSTTYTFIVG
jgi:hypothetical protein